MAVLTDFQAYPEWVGILERVAFQVRSPVLSASYTRVESG
jgi:hypothetical protein